MKEVVLVHYAELALKGENRPFYERRLIDNLKRSCGGLAAGVLRLYGRLVVIPENDIDVTDLEARVADVLGIADYGRGIMTEADWSQLLEATRQVLPDGEKTFGVRARIADQDWERSKSRTERDVGTFVGETTGWKVDLKQPDVWVRVDVSSRRAIVSASRTRGRGGLPVGSSGKAVALLSGGIDSPVAAYMMMTRGCRMLAVHFHSAPYTSAASQDKVVELASALTRYQPEMDLVMVPFAAGQRRIVAKTPEALRVILYRRFMMRFATRLARRHKARALVTGEAVGQVASQTLANLRSVEDAAGLPVLRPLVAMGKDWIRSAAEDLGTYDISVRPHDDCCSYLMPKRPATRSRVPEVLAAEEALDVIAIVREMADRAETIHIVGCPRSRTPH